LDTPPEDYYLDRERLYLARVVYLNFAASKAAAEDLRARGYFVFSPVERDMERCGTDPSNPTGYPMQAEVEHGLTLRDCLAGLTLRDCLADDLIWICRNATAVVVLPDWEKSRSAQAEVHTARALGVPVLTLDEALRAW
jgi:Domain of unknown function (DUF4406)